MPFESGTQSFIICHLEKKITPEMLNSFAEHVAAPIDQVTIEEQKGWVTGRHLLDRNINEETAYIGGYLYLSLRSASKKVPAALYKAECRIEELAYMQANKSINVPQKQKKAIKELISERLLPSMPPTITGISFTVDSNNNTLYLAATSVGKIEAFLNFFGETLGFEPMPLYPEKMAEVLFGVHHLDVMPLRFTARNIEVNDEPSLGRDFLTWLWYFQDEEGGTFTIDNIEGDFAIQITEQLVLTGDCPGAMESVIRKGTPTNSAEAKAALLGGKKLRRSKLQLVHEKEVWTFGLDADTFVFSGVKLPEGEALDPMSHYQERMLYFNILKQAFLKLFDLFLQQVVDEKQADQLCDSLSSWTEDLHTTLPEK